MNFTFTAIFVLTAAIVLVNGMPSARSNESDNVLRTADESNSETSKPRKPTTVIQAARTRKCSKTNPIRYNPPLLFNPAGYGNSQISIERNSHIAYIQPQTCIQSDRSIPGKTQVDQLEFAALNVKMAVESLETSLNSVLSITVRIVNFDPAAHLLAVMKMGKAFNSPALSIVGVQSLNFPDLLVSIEATVLVNKSFIRQLKHAQCLGNTLVAKNT